MILECISNQNLVSQSNKAKRLDDLRMQNIHLLNKSIINQWYAQKYQTNNTIFFSNVNGPTFIIDFNLLQRRSFIFGRYIALNKQDKCSEKTCNVYGVRLNTFIYQNIYMICIDIQKKRVAYKIFDSKITTFLLKLLAISFFTYEESTTYIKTI